MLDFGVTSELPVVCAVIPLIIFFDVPIIILDKALKKLAGAEPSAAR